MREYKFITGLEIKPVFSLKFNDLLHSMPLFLHSSINLLIRDDESVNMAVYKNCKGGNGRWIRQVNDHNRHMNLLWPRANHGRTYIPLRPFSFNSQWQPGMDQGVANWNSSPANVYFRPNASSNNVVRVITENDWTSLGRLTSTRSTNLTTESTTTMIRLDLNITTINSHITNNGFTRANVITSIMTHELGHVIGLSDNPSGGGSNSIMSHSRNRNQITRPGNFDIQSVNMLYN